MEILAYILAAVAAVAFAIFGALYSQNKVPMVLLFGFGVLLTDGAMCAYWIHKIWEGDSRPAQTEPTPPKSDEKTAAPTIEQTVPPTKPGEETKMADKKSPDKQTSKTTNQTMINSPGGIQAGRDVNIHNAPQPRRLTSEQRQLFLRNLANGPAGIVDLESPSDDAEAGAFAGEVRTALVEAGWRINAFARAQYPNGINPRGIEIGIFTESQREQAMRLTNAFEGIGLKVKNSSSENANPPPIVVLVGSKPE